MKKSRSRLQAKRDQQLLKNNMGLIIIGSVIFFILGIAIGMLLAIRVQATSADFANNASWVETAKQDTTEPADYATIEEPLESVSATTSADAHFNDRLASEPQEVSAKVTAYSCGGLETEAEIRMNCPSLFYGEPKTANGTTPIPMKTVACDRANLNKQFEIETIGIVTCTDTGGAITGAGRFDLYVETVDEAWDWGVKHLKYSEIDLD